MFDDFCFVKQKTTYEMRISDWSSDVCSSELGLRIICLGVFMDLLGCQGRPGGVAAAGIADHGGEVPDQEYDGMAKVLQLAHFIEDHRMSQVDVGRPEERRGGEACVRSCRSRGSP